MCNHTTFFVSMCKLVCSDRAAMLYSSSRRRCDGPAEQSWGWSAMSGRQLLHVSWRQPVWAARRGGDGVQQPCRRAGTEGVCVCGCVRSKTVSLAAEPFTSVFVVAVRSRWHLFTLVRSLMMGASATLLHTSPCSQRTWIPCRSVGAFMPVERWWWVSAEPLRQRSRRRWLALPTVARLAFNLRPDDLVRIKSSKCPNTAEIQILTPKVVQL